MAKQRDTNRDDDDRPWNHTPMSVFYRGMRPGKYNGPGLVRQCEREAARRRLEQRKRNDRKH